MSPPTYHFDIYDVIRHKVIVPTSLSKTEAVARRKQVLEAARWCFLNFGFAKTTLDDIAKRARLSRTLLYRAFKDKEAIFDAVFVDWLVSRREAAEQFADGPGAPAERLLAVCRLLVIEPWAEMICTPMGGEFLEACERVAPASDALYQNILLGCVRSVLKDNASAEVFLLAIGGLSADRPGAPALDGRAQVLIARFTSQLSSRRRP